jgi:D-glycero-D-manno-heptose 1,7-bisphosphate phosphatase
MAPQPALFLDRDGVVNRELGYVHRPEDFHFIDGVFAACRKMRQAGFRLFIITNQAGIARGYYSEADYNQLTQWMLNEFSKHGIEIDDVYYCPHHPVHGIGCYRRHCDCRKPAPGMIVRAAKEHSLDLQRSILVGDKATDIEAGRSAGVGHCVLVLTGHSLGAADKKKADSVFADLRCVAQAFANNPAGPDQ